jgi:hypothetical protein
VTVQRNQSSIKLGQAATYVVEVSAENGSVSDVSVTLTAQPSGQTPEFTSGCAKGDGTATCGVGSVTTKQPTSLEAQIAVASKATSVKSVTLTATASIATTAKWTPPAAAETTAVTATPASASASASASGKSKRATSSAGVPHEDVLPLGPIPALNSEASMLIGNGDSSSILIGAGSAAGLFPAISPSPLANPAAPLRDRALPTKKPNAAPVSEASPVSLGGTQGLSIQAAGLIALGVAIMLAVTRLSARKKPRSGK